MTGSAARPRVLILATRVPLESGDGTPSFVLDNASAMADDFDITILAPRIKGSRAVSEQDGVTVRRFPYFPARWERLADDAIMPQLGSNPLLWVQAAPLVGMMLWHTVKEHRDRPIALIHANWIIPAGLVAAAMNRLHAIPYVTTSRGADAFRLNRWPLRELKQAVVDRSARFIGVSRDIVEQFPTSRCPVEVQPSGIDFSAWEHTAEHGEPSRATVLFVGRLAAKKGVADAIRAVTRLDGVELRIVGDGPLEQELRMLAASLSGGERVVFLARRSRAEVAQEMRAALCLVIPSVTASDGDRDGTPNVLGEAIAAGLPVIASDIAGLSEFVVDGETGRLHDPGDVEGLEVALRSFLNEPEDAARLAVEARSRLAAVFDIRQVAQRYTRWYREAIMNSQGRSDGLPTKDRLIRAAIFAPVPMPSDRAHVGAIVGMANAVVHFGHATELYAFTRKGASEQLRLGYGLENSVRLGSSLNRLARLRMGLALLDWIRIVLTQRFELVLSRDPIVALFSWRSALTLLELHQEPVTRPLRGKFDRLILPLLRSDRVKFVVITERLRGRIRADFPHLDASRFVVAPSGFRADWYPGQWERSPGHGRIAYVGSLYPGRGVETVIELARRLPDVEVHVAGGSIEQWESLVDGGDVPPNCLHRPHIPPVDVPGLLRSCDVLLAPYQQQARIASGEDIAPWMSPLKLVEYLAAGRAIVASDLPMARELLTDAVDALLVNPSDIGAWASAVRGLVDDPERRDRLGRAAHRTAHGVLDWDSRLVRILGAFERPAPSHDAV